MDIRAYIQSGIIESYVLGLASVEEQAELEALRAQHREVDEAIDVFSFRLEEQLMTDTIAPRADVKSKVMAAIKEKTKPAPLVAFSAHNTPPDLNKQRFRLWKRLAAACIILFIVSAVLNLYLYNKYRQKNEAYESLVSQRNILARNNNIYLTELQQWKSVAEMVADPGMALIKMQGVPGKPQYSATLFWNTKNKDVYIILNRLPSPPLGKQYQLWALVNQKPVDAGMLSLTCIGPCKMKKISQAEGFAITLENEGGSPIPTMNAMYVLGKV